MVVSDVVRFGFHATRLYGWLPGTLWLLRYQYGRLFVLFYTLARRSSAWRSFVHHLFQYGVKDSPACLKSRMSAPLKPASEKRYMICVHPHGLLCDGWHIVIAKEPTAFLPDHADLGGIANLKPFLCFSPLIQYVPAHQELYRERCGGASTKDLDRVLKTTDCNPVICPGGFAEAVFCWSDQKTEYSWLKGNSRFMALAIKKKLDIVITYTYGVTSMYRTNTLFRQQLAELAQKYKLPLVPFWGKFLSHPLHEDVTTVVYDPFPVDKYTLDDVEQALLDYQVYLKKCFDQDKAKYGMGDKELAFIGPSSQKGAELPAIRSKL